MAHAIRIELGPGSGRGRLWVDDVEIHELVEISVHAGLDDVARVSLTLLPQSISITGLADVGIVVQNEAAT